MGRGASDHHHHRRATAGEKEKSIDAPHMAARPDRVKLLSDFVFDDGGRSAAACGGAFMSAAATITPLAASNSLADLAGRIKIEHQAVAIALKGSIEHAIAAGELLIEAKAQIQHGGWLPWLRDHCNISERMAQRYLRLARNRAALEAKSDIVSDLSIGGALALLTVPKELNDPSDLLAVASIETLSDSQDCGGRAREDYRGQQAKAAAGEGDRRPQQDRRVSPVIASARGHS